MKKKHICFVAGGYPTKSDPEYTFVKQLVNSIADNGIKCTVIVPQSFTKIFLKKKNKRPYHWIDKSQNGLEIDVFQPLFFSFSNLKVFNFSLSQLLWKKSVISSYKKEKIKADIIYGHFWHAGIVAAVIGKIYSKPSFVASGESVIKVHQLYSEKYISKYKSEVSGVICVSTKNMEESLKLNLAPRKKMVVIPNAVDKNMFYKKSKKESRKILGFNEDDFIVAFTGSFSHRKGVLRVSQAVNQLNGVKAIYIGSGKQNPQGPNVLFNGKVSHQNIVDYLNSADVFVLPTLAEGCSNAIIEAMACGLPIVSSDKSFNDDILSQENSIRVNSEDINAVANAIKDLNVNPKLRSSMGINALETAQTLSIESRALKIIDYIENAQ